MPETFGIPDPEPTPEERIREHFNEVVAGRGPVRTVSLYVAVAVLTLLPWPFGVLAIVPLLLLLASDGRLA